MEEEFEERIARLERREFADRCAIVALTAMLARVAQDDFVRKALVSWGGRVSDDAGSVPGGIEEAKELFVTLAALVAGFKEAE